MLNGNSPKYRLKWRFGIIAGLFLALFSLYPQLKLVYNQDGEWQGHYAYNDIDEVAYAAYLKALIDGRPRKNDPYTGRDEAAGAPQPESLFSIQFAAPYAVAIPSKLLGISAPTAMTASGAISAFLAALFIFWLIASITESHWMGMAGALVVLTGGAIAAGEGAVGEILGTGFSYPYFPFLRRYVPALPFAAFAALMACVWLWLSEDKPRKRAVLTLLSGLLFSFLVFSYFYIWTAAAAWLACLGLLRLIFDHQERRDTIFRFSFLGAVLLVPLVAYAVLLSGRSETMDHVQLLVYTRQPDLIRFPALICFAAVVLLLLGARLGRVSIRSAAAVFAFSLALTPIVLFNQQVVTGRSLQPIHYQVFIGNYIAATSFVLAAFLFFKREAESRAAVSSAICASLATIAICWGFVECHFTVRVLDEANIARDDLMPLAARLNKLAENDDDPFRSTIFSVSNIHADDSPTVAPQNVLWSRHQHVFAGLTWQESKERYYKYLYYQGFDEMWLERRLKSGDFVSMIALFGWGRHSDRLSSASSPLTYREIEVEARRFGDFIRNFSRTEAGDPELSYTVVPSNWDVDLSNLKKWYEVGAGEQVGGQTIYKLTLKGP